MDKAFHQKGTKLVQIDRFGYWHGYLDCFYKESFNNEQEAITWLNSKI